MLAPALAGRLLLQFLGRQLRAKEPDVVRQVGLNEVLEGLGGDDLRRDFYLLASFAGKRVDHVQGSVDGDVGMVADDVRLNLRISRPPLQGAVASADADHG